MCPWQLCRLYVARWEPTLAAAAVKRPRHAAAAACLQNVLQRSFNTNTSQRENRKLSMKTFITDQPEGKHMMPEVYVCSPQMF